MKKRAEVVVIGGGILGCGVAYELARKGLSDVVLVEKNELTAGTTWHSAGHLLLLDDDPEIAKINAMSLEIYFAFQKDTGEDIGLHPDGSIRLATNQNRLDRLQRLTEKTAAIGYQTQMVGPDEIKKLFPLINVEGVLGGNWSPREGRVDPSMTTQAFARLARKLGVEINRNTPVTNLKKEGGHWVVETKQGNIVANHVIVAGGFWAPSILRGLGINIPILPAERQYLITEEVPELKERAPQQLPILRDFDVPFYFRQEGNSLLMGVHEPHTPFCFENGIPDDFGQELLPPDLERGSACIEAGMFRVPKLADVGIKRVICGPTSRTVDFNGLVGPVPGHKNLHLLSGFSAGIGHGAAVTRLLAEWMIDGAPSLDISPLHASRFGDFATTYYIRQLLGEAHTYGSLDPSQERQAGRRALTSPLYHRHKSAGAIFVQKRGWEMASCFPNGSGLKPNQAAEHELKLLKEKCGVLDRSASTKIEISGEGALAFLRDAYGIDPKNSTGQTQRIAIKPLKNEKPITVTLACLDSNLFYMTADPEHGPLLLSLMNQKVQDDSNVVVRDVSGGFAVLALMGPSAAAAFSQLVPPNVDLATVGQNHAGAMDVGYAPARVLRHSIENVDTWEIHVAPQYLVGIDDLIQMKAGVQDVGFLAFDTLSKNAPARVANTSRLI